MINQVKLNVDCTKPKPVPAHSTNLIYKANLT